MIVLQLWLLLCILNVLLCIGFITFMLLSKLDTIIKLIIKLDKPTREEIIGKMTTTEAQKEVIRAECLFENHVKLASRIFANDIAKVLGGK
jgi:hypothetical protein